MTNPEALTPEAISPSDILGKGTHNLQDSSSYATLRNEMESHIVDLCQELDRRTSQGEFDCVSWISSLEAYTEDYNKRILYSVISNYIFQKNEQEFTTFSTNLEKVMEYAVEHIRPDDEKQALYRTVVKFYDHVSLAHQQQIMFSQKRDDLKQEMTSFLEPKISEITKEMTSQLVGLVGIFTALSFIVFGGISSLSSIFTSMQQTLNQQHSVLPVLIVAVAWAFCLMNLLFGFMYFVLRIAKYSQQEQPSAKNLVQRYPVVFLCDYILLALFLLFSGMWFAKCNGVGESIFSFAVVQHSTGTFWVGLILSVIVVIGLGVWLWHLYTMQSKSL